MSARKCVAWLLGSAPALVRAARTHAKLAPPSAARAEAIARLERAKHDALLAIMIATNEGGGDESGELAAAATRIEQTTSAIIAGLREREPS